MLAQGGKAGGAELREALGKPPLPAAGPSDRGEVARGGAAGPPLSPPLRSRTDSAVDLQQLLQELELGAGGAGARQRPTQGFRAVAENDVSGGPAAPAAAGD